MRIFVAALAVSLVGCHAPSVAAPKAPSRAEQTPESTSEMSPAPSVAKGGDTCPPPVEPEVAAETFERGRAKLEASRDGEHFDAEKFQDAIATLKIAADHGNVDAQSLYGRSLFGVRFTAGAPTPQDKDDYVSALAFLRIAALADDADAAGYLPGLTAAPGASVMPPLDSLPDGWVAEAFERADAWVACHSAQ